MQDQGTHSLMAGSSNASHCRLTCSRTLSRSAGAMIRNAKRFRIGNHFATRSNQALTFASVSSSLAAVSTFAAEATFVAAVVVGMAAVTVHRLGLLQCGRALAGQLGPQDLGRP